MRALELQLLRVAHMPQRAAAAFGEIRAVRLRAVRRRLFHAQQLRENRRAADVRDTDFAHLARQRAGHKHDLSVDARNARSIHGCGLDRRLQRIAAFEFLHSSMECFT